MSTSLTSVHQSWTHHFVTIIKAFLFILRVTVITLKAFFGRLFGAAKFL